MRNPRDPFPYTYEDCRLCPRMCRADRTQRTGFCQSGSEARVARAALHQWEEPCISGKNGSGTIFFTGCTLGCCFCQNHVISRQGVGKEVTPEELCRILLRLQDQGAHNINLVTATHYLPSVTAALRLAGSRLTIPVVYNCGGYENPDVIRALDPYVDIWLPDLKYYSSSLSARYSGAKDYFTMASQAILQMVSQAGPPVLDENGRYAGMVSRRNLMSMQKKQVILVDHNERSQAVEGIGEAEILEIIDHHRLGALETVSPVYFRNQPLGCTSTIIYQMYLEKAVEIPKQIAGLLLSAILSDTLMFRSPTCTASDREAAEQLARIAEVEIEEHAKNMFRAGSDFKHKTTEEIVYQDFKIFHADDCEFGVAQVSVMSREELEQLSEQLKPQLTQVLGQKKLDMVYMMLTDILEESSKLIFAGRDAGRILAEAYRREETPEGIWLPGVVSRKKQLIPALMNALAEL